MDTSISIIFQIIINNLIMYYVSALCMCLLGIILSHHHNAKCSCYNDNPHCLGLREVDESPQVCTWYLEEPGYKLGQFYPGAPGLY